MGENKYKIGIMGSAGRGKKIPKSMLKKAREVGREIAKNNCILITGACMGIPYESVKGATEEDGIVLGFSPAANLKEHLEPPVSYPPSLPNEILIFTGFGKEGRNVVAIRTCEAVIFIAGHSGALHEFSLAYQLGKVIGLLSQTGGITEKIPVIAKFIKKNTGALIISDSKPKNLVKRLINVLQEKKYGKANCF